MKIIVVLFFLLVPYYTYAQVKSVKLEKKEVPSSIKYVGRLVDAQKYTDKEGEHIIVITETGQTKTKDTEGDNFKEAAVYAYDYIIRNNRNVLIWQVYDFVKDCDVDIIANYVPKTFAVTDLDKNGIAEVWLMYKTACRGDVSPSTMKIIMYEGNKKYAVRGTSKVRVSNKEYDGGKFTFDEAFKNGSELFRGYASKLWTKNLLEKW